MKDEDKTKEQLLNELLELRQRIAEMEASGEECKRAEQSWRENEERFRTIVNTALDSIFIKDGSCKYQFVNTAMERLFGVPASGLLGKTDEELFGKDAGKHINEVDRRVFQGEVVEEEHTKPVQDVLTTFHVIKVPMKDTAGNIVGLCGIARDITERKRAEEALRKAHEELERRVEERTADLAINNKQLEFEIAERKRVEETIKHRLQFEKAVSAISSRLINVSKIDDAINASLVDMGQLSGADRAYLFLFHQDGTIMENTHEWCAEGVTSEIDNLKNLPSEMFLWWIRKLYKGEVLHIKDVSTMPAEAKAEKAILERQNIKSLLVLPVNIKGGVAGFIGFDNVRETGEWTDDDLAILRTSSELIGNSLERRRAEEALHESEERYRTLFDLSPQAIALTDVSTGRLIAVNDEFCRRTKYTREEILERTTTELFYSEEKRGKFIRKLQESGEIRGLEMDFRVKDGSIINTLMFSKLILIAGESFILTILLDLTHLKRLEAQLLQAQKMEAIGTLAGGIAHDFNNLLMGIQGNASLMLLDIDPDHPHYKKIESIQKQVQSGAKLTGQLLGYARKGRYEVKPLNLNELVKESSEAFGRTRKEITIYREFAEDLFTVEADKNQIEQVLWNMYVNAADAMPGSGNLILKTMNATHEDMKRNLGNPSQCHYVRLTITDTGIGMDKETMERIFDPFFTTKELGRGTGLGLASTYGIIKGHSGYIDVASEKGAGTTFNIYLPVSEKKAHRTTKAAERFVKGMGTVLLVDDEEVILELGQELLKVMGYRVLVARDGKEAIDVYRNNQDDIDIIVLDMVMPNMGGGEAYDRMKEINPDIKVLLSSGYSIEGQATEILGRGCDGFIQKPFNIEALSRKIREILEKQKVMLG
jgi:two-component system cell cycle sensor histidine kinase/response regulator CckA